MTGNAPSTHAAIVGILASDTAREVKSARWESSIDRSASRCPREVTRLVHPLFAAAYRGAPGGFFHDADWTLLLDGYVDNLQSLAMIHQLTSVAGQFDQAQTLARLISIEDTPLLAKLTGSFAVALVRNDTGETLLIRDRFGTKPLFYARLEIGWAWASEIKCICPLLERPELDEEGLRQSIHYRYMVGDTLVKGVRQVMPASFVQLTQQPAPLERSYWRLDFHPESRRLDLDYWADRTDAALDASFSSIRREHDEIGVLLSGGVDSSLLALKASRSGFGKCIAFTARWPGDNPELDWATDVTRKLGIEHRIVDIDESCLERALPRLVWRMEEAPRHFNSFTLASLFEAAAGSCKVLLNGHAADAMFGPQSCVAIDAYLKRQAQLHVVPQCLRAMLSGVLPDHADFRSGRLKRYLSQDIHGFMKTQFQIHYGKLGERLFSRYYHSIEPGRSCLDLFYDAAEEPIERFQRFDLYTFNQSHMAVFDRLSAPLEIVVKLPFLSPEMVEVAAGLPSTLKRHGETSKPVLKRLASRYFPSEWIYRAKLGFPTPTSRWLGGPLNKWTELLDGSRGLMRDRIDLQALKDAKVGRDDEAIWTAMTLEIFRRQFTGNGESSPSPVQ